MKAIRTDVPCHRHGGNALVSHLCRKCREEAERRRRERKAEELISGYVDDAPFDWVWKVK